MDSASQNGNKSQNGGLIDGWCVNGDDVGTGIMAEGSKAQHERANDKVVHSKAIRRLAAYFKEVDSLGDRELMALSIVNLWCEKLNRQGGPVNVIVAWSGFTKGWKAKVHQGIRDCLAIGALEEIPVNAGLRLCVTLKGHRILDVYCKMFEKVEEEFNLMEEKELRKVEARQVRKSLVKSLRAA